MPVLPCSAMLTGIGGTRCPRQRDRFEAPTWAPRSRRGSSFRRWPGAFWGPSERVEYHSDPVAIRYDVHGTPSHCRVRVDAVVG